MTECMTECAHIEMAEIAPRAWQCVACGDIYGYPTPTGNTFEPLPRDEWREIQGGCCCLYCTADKKKPGQAFWDTRAVPAGGVRSYTVHFPELHGATRKRENW